MVGAGVVSTLLTRGDLRGLSMLRPTKLHRGILNICLHADSPGKQRNGQKREGSRESQKERRRQRKGDTHIK